MTEYRADDRSMLGEPPWKPTDPALIEWEKQHGHDVRLDCDWDCYIVRADYEAAVNALEEAISFAEDYDYTGQNIERWDAILGRLRGES